MTNLKKTTFISLFKILSDLKINPRSIFTLNSQTNIISFHNKSRIFLMDMSHQPSDPLYTRFGGLELTGAFVDESNENDGQAIEILKTRIGRGKNKEYNLLPKILETFNPSKNHVYIRYYRPFVKGELPDYRIFIKSLATDNVNLDKSYITQLMNSEKVTRERLLYGNFEYDDDPTKIFDYDKILDMFTLDAERGDKYCIVDQAGFGRDKCMITYWDGLFVTEVEMMDNISAKELDERLLKRKIPRSQCLVDEVGVGFGLVNELKGILGFVANSAALKSTKETEEEKVTHNYKNLRSQCWFELANHINSGRIGVYRNIPIEVKDLLIEDLEVMKQMDTDKDTTLRVITKQELKDTGALNRSTDAGDVWMMRMYFEINPNKGAWAFPGTENKQPGKIYGDDEIHIETINGEEVKMIGDRRLVE